MAVLIYLYSSLNGDLATIVSTLEHDDKLKLLDLSFTGGFSFWTLITGWFLLNIGAYGLDQDMAQRVLTCKSGGEGKRSLIYSALLTIPIVVLFLIIGLLLYLFYTHPELSGLR